MRKRGRRGIKFLKTKRFQNQQEFCQMRVRPRSLFFFFKNSKEPRDSRTRKKFIKRDPILHKCLKAVQVSPDLKAGGGEWGDLSVFQRPLTEFKLDELAAASDSSWQDARGPICLKAHPLQNCFGPTWCICCCCGLDRPLNYHKYVALPCYLPLG